MHKLKLVDSANKPLQDFDLFWENYPKHRAKFDAEKAWRQMHEKLPPIDELIAIIDRQCNSADWLKDGGAYIPYPSTYLRQGRWLDDE